MNQAKPKLVLASQSPRRRQLLAEHGYEFEVRPPSETAECGICSRETPPELVARLAMQKARDVAQGVEQGLVLGGDTVAECCGQILQINNDSPPDVDQESRVLHLLKLLGLKKSFSLIHD